MEDVEAAFRRGEEVEGQLWDAWDRLIRAADTPDDAARERLVAEVLRIRDRGPLTRADGTVCRVWGAVVFSDLPVFGAQMREVWNRDGTPEFWRRMNAFAARLTVAGVDFSLYGVWAMRWALEESEARMPLTSVAAWLRYDEQFLARDLPPAPPGDLARAAGIDGPEVTARRRLFWRQRLSAAATPEATAALRCWNGG